MFKRVIEIISLLAIGAFSVLLMPSAGRIINALSADWLDSHFNIYEHQRNFIYDQTTSIMANLSLDISHVREADERIYNFCHPNPSFALPRTSQETVLDNLRNKLQTLTNDGRLAYNMHEISYDKYIAIQQFAKWNNQILKNEANMCALQPFNDNELQHKEDELDCKVFGSCGYPSLTREKTKTR